MTRPLSPASAPMPDRTARIAEAIVLGVLGATVLVIAVTDPGINGMMLRLNELRPVFAVANVIACACACVGVLGAIVLAFRGKTGTGALVMALVFCACGFLLNAGVMEGSRSADPKPVPVMYEIQLEDGTPGADVWVNGVHIGKTPIEMTVNALLAKVPQWTKVPDRYRERTPRVTVPTFHIDRKTTRDFSQWGGLTAPRRYYGPAAPKEESRRLFFRVQLGDECGGWQGYSGRGSGGYGTGVDPHYRYRVALEIRLPARDQRLRALLNKARRSHYRVSKEWCRALDTYGKPGWTALREAATADPRMGQVFEAWLVWRYELADLADEGSAWAHFMRVCEEVDGRNEYSTASLDGLAVELLTPKLNAQRLVDYAERLIKRYRTWPWNLASCKQAGRLQFRALFVDSPSGWCTPLSVAVAAHAVWTLDQLLDASGADEPNIVEQKITPALIRWGVDMNSLEAACVLGGPDIDRFLLNGYWRSRHRATRQHKWRRHRPRYMGWDVNPWLYLLANLETQAGRDFRAKHTLEIMKLARGLHFESSRPLDFCGFLFVDLDRGAKSLAARYWPQYRDFMVQSRPHSELFRYLWEYLRRMEPVSTTEMYVDAWRILDRGDGAIFAGLGDLRDLPLAKRRAIAEALERAMGPEPKPPNDWDRRAAGWRRDLRQSLDSLRRDRNGEDPQSWLTKLRADSSGEQRKHMALWLEHTRPDHPLVAMLASDDDPALRLLAMGALKNHPTPENRRILVKLLVDDNLEVRAEAERVTAELEALAKQDPMELKCPSSRIGASTAD